MKLAARMDTEFRRKNCAVNGRTIVKKKKFRINKLRFSMFLVLLCSATVFTALRTMKVFDIKEIHYEGFSKISEERVAEVSKVMIGDNIFKLSVGKIAKRISIIPYVNSIQIWRNFPNKLHIKIEECEPFVFAENEQGMFVLDASGKVVEQVDDYSKYNIPVVVGLDEKKMVLGKTLLSKKGEKLDLALICALKAKEFNLFNHIGKIDVSEIENVKLRYQNRIDIRLGNTEKILYKMEFLAKTIDQHINQIDKGVLDFTGENLSFIPAK